MTQEKEPKDNRGRSDEAKDPAREGGLGSRREEAPGQNKPAVEVDVNVDTGGDEPAAPADGEAVPA